MESDKLEELYEQELKLSETTEDDPNLKDGEGPQEPSWEPPEGGCCDMPMEQYDPALADGIPQDGSLCEVPAEAQMEQEINDLALAEPEPPEERDGRH